MIQPTTDERAKEIFGSIWDLGYFRNINPEHFATTFHRPVNEVMDLMDQVQADRATRLAPNAAPEIIGEGK